MGNVFPSKMVKIDLTKDIEAQLDQLIPDGVNHGRKNERKRVPEDLGERSKQKNNQEWWNERWDLNGFIHQDGLC
mgnify:CR=1 FL=1